MFRTFVILIFYFSNINILLAQDVFEKLIELHANDTVITNELNEFKNSGFNYSINLNDITVEKIIKRAGFYLNTPHCMGGTSKKCMDCSGLIYAVFRDLGVNVPHNSQEQARYGEIIPENRNLKKGDLVFFIRSYNTNYFITHAGIYLGNDEFIHTSSQKGVSVSTIKENSYWEGKFIFGTRIFKDSNKTFIFQRRAN